MRRSALVAAGLFLAAFLLRVAALDRDRGFRGDEGMAIPTAHNYGERGHLGPDSWYHPPLRHLVTYAAIRALGDDPWGWRLPNVIFGAGTVALLFLLGEALLGSSRAGLVAALLLALDPLHLAMSRSTDEDVSAALFIVAGALLCARQLRSGRWPSLLGAGLSLGLAVALRRYALVPLLAAAAALSAAALLRRRPAGLLAIAACLIVLPFALYLAAYAPWFLRGYGLGEWLELERNGLAAATTAAAEGFKPLLMQLAHPGRWFVVPVGVALPSAGASSPRVQAIMNDLPIWILVLPAVAALSVEAIRRRRWDLGAVPAAFGLLYAPFLLAARPIFLYSSLAVIPFGFLAVGWAAGRLPARLAWALAGAAVLWGLYLYPLAVGAPAPPGLHAPVLAWIRTEGP